MPLSAALTSFGEKEILDSILNNDSYKYALDGLHVALHTADPTEGAQTTNEISTSSGGYERQSAFFDNSTTNTSTSPHQSEAVNSSDISWTPSGATWSNVSHYGVYRRNSFTRTFDGTLSSQRFEIPASYIGSSTTLRTVVNSTRNSTNSYNELNLASGTHVAGSRSGTDPVGQIKYFVRVKSGPLSGQCFMIHSDDTDKIILLQGASGTPEDWNGQVIEICQMMTIKELVGTPSTSGLEELMASGWGAGPRDHVVGDTADALWITSALDATGSTLTTKLYANTVRGQWEEGSNSAGAGTSLDDVVVPPSELQHSVGEGIYLYGNSGAHAGDWTLSGQISGNDMIFRGQFEDSSGTPTTHTISDGSTFTIAAGDLKLTLT